MTEPNMGDSQYIDVDKLPDVNEFNLNDMVLFDTGLVHAELVKVPADPAFPGEGQEYRPFILFYGKCYSGNKCMKVHGNLIEPHLFYSLVERINNALLGETLSNVIDDAFNKFINGLDNPDK